MNVFFLSIANITKNSNSHMKLLFSFFVINAEAVAKTCSVKKVFLEISQKWQENTCVRVSILIKLQAYNFIQIETLAQGFSCDSCEISKNTFSYRAPPVAASLNVGNFEKFDRTPFLPSISDWLLLLVFVFMMSYLYMMFIKNSLYCQN